MRKSLLIALVLIIIGGAGYAYYAYTKKPQPPTITTAKITRGDIAETVGATGQLQAVTTVQVGTQVSGTVSQLNADFNSLVHKGQVIARLDPSLFQTQIEQGRANLIRAQADLDRLRVALDDAQTKLRRAQELAQKQLIAQADLEAAQVAVRSADAQLKSQEAAVTQSRASLQQAQVNLDHTIITAPIDGLVISRNVDVGQTVAASMSAPTLFVLAADLTKMQVIASLDESDVGRIRPGQPVIFRVDAYPNQQFHGSVTQVRLQPQTIQNVVTYSTVIDVPNPDLRLKPGMTANVNIEIAQRADVLRIPNAALRFRPTAEIFQALGQTPPPGGLGGTGRGRRGGRGSDAEGGPNESSTAVPGGVVASAASGTADGPQRGSRGTNLAADAAQSARSVAPKENQSASTERRPRQGADPSAQPSESADASGRGGRGGGWNGENGGGGRRGNFQERLANMTPEEREAFMQRMRDRGIDPAAMMARAGQPPVGGNANAQQARSTSGGRSAGAGPRGGAQPQTAGRSGSAGPGNGSATTIDALFGPLPPTEGFGQVWLNQNGKLTRVPIRTGITDGQQTELLRGDLKEGQDVVTNVTTKQGTGAAAPNTTFPGFQQQRGGFGGGGFGGGGRGGGR